MSSATHVPNSNEMAMERTWLAHERTLMAWIRTAASMISFGFTIYKFFQFEEDRPGAVRRGLGVFTPRDFALMMVGMGLFSLVAATITHRRNIRRMGNSVPGMRSLAGVVAWVVSGFGVLVFVATLLRD